MKIAELSAWVKLPLIVIATALAVVGVVWLEVEWLGQYGWSAFVGVPFGVGLITGSTHLIILGRPLRCGVATLQGWGVCIVAAGIMLVMGMEGLICFLMLAPLAMPIVGCGVIAANLLPLGSHHSGRTRTYAVAAMALLAVPTLGIDHVLNSQPPLMSVVTSVVIAAPPEIVWKHVVTFEDVPPPQDLLFKLGVAYPTHAEISGHGVGAIRRCVFSTGTFVEPIEVWDEPRLLRFSVEECPPPMRELSPHGAIETRHLHGYFVSEAGQFKLTQLEDGQTRLEGTTWYRHRIAPAAYWKLWSDYLIHRIHLQVLTHIKALAEREAEEIQPDSKRGPTDA